MTPSPEAESVFDRMPRRAAAELLAGLLLVLAAGYLQWQMGLLHKLGRELHVTHEFLGKGTGSLGYADLKDLWLLASDLFLMLPGVLLLARGAGRLEVSGRLVGLPRQLTGRRAPLVAALVAAGLVGLATFVLVGGTPVVDDGWAYMVQARILARGQAVLPAGLYPRLLETSLVLVDARRDVYASQYHPGWPLMLVPGTLLGNPWGTLPLLTGLLLLLVHATGRRLYGEGPVPALATLLVASSPFFLVHGSTLHSQPASLAWLLAAFLLVTTPADAPAATLRHLAAGLCWGVALNTRSMSAVVTIPALVFLLRGEAGAARRLGAVALGAVPGVGVFLGWNQLVTGHWWLTPIDACVGFRMVGWWGSDVPALRHTPVRSLLGVLTQLVRLDDWAFGWPASLAGLPLLGLLPLRRQDRFLLLWMVTHLAGYSLHFFAGVSITGPVYSYELLLPLALLTARVLVHAWERTGGRPVARRTLVVLLVLLSVGSLAYRLPCRMLALREVAARARAPYRELARQVPEATLWVLDLQPGAQPGWRIGWDVMHPDLVPAGEPLALRSTRDLQALLYWLDRRHGRRVAFLQGHPEAPRVVSWSPGDPLPPPP